MSTVAEEVTEEISDDFMEAFESDEIIQDEPEKEVEESESEDSEDSEESSSEGDESNTAESDSTEGESDDDEEEEKLEKDSDSNKPSEREEALEKQVEALKARLEPKEEKEKEEEQETEEVEEESPDATIDDIIKGLDEEDQADFKEIFLDFPALKNVLEKINEKAKAKVKPEVNSKDEEKKAQHQENLESGRFWGSLIKERPDARDVSNSKEFQTWLDSQDRGLQALADSLNKDDALLVLDAYDATKARAEEKRQELKVKKEAKKEVKKSLISGDKKASGVKKASNEDEFQDAFYEESN